MVASKAHLDRINVFPVPDGDTGTNLAMTLAAILAELDRDVPLHAGQLLTRIADAAIDGARGNSGAILAQFLLGFGDRAGALEELATGDFAAATQTGAAYAREALSEPREGTILSVLDAFAREVVRLASHSAAGDFRRLFALGLTRARAALAATPDQLEALRAANVVDAGAQGFVTLLEGMSLYLETGESGPAPRFEAAAGEPAARVLDDTTYRYCAECVVTGERVEHRRLREQLSALGSSVVVAGTHRKTRVHLHTNEPQRAFALAARFGAVSGQKADDMLKQQLAATRSVTRRVAVVTDSAADIPDEALERLEVHVVPARVHFGARSYLDKVSLSNEEFYAELARSPEHPKTSQPPPGDFRRLYEFLGSHYESIVSVQLASRLSGTFNAACTAATRLPPGRVTVIDSGTASVGEGLIAIHAAECAMAGLDAARVAAEARSASAATATYGILGNLEWAVRGGRLSRPTERLAHWLRLTPVLTNRPGGRIAPGGFLVGRRAVSARFAAFVRRRMREDACYRVAVGHANAEAEGRMLLENITRGFQIDASWLVPLGSALGVHGGPGMLAVGVQRYAPPAFGGSPSTRR